MLCVPGGLGYSAGREITTENNDIAYDLGRRLLKCWGWPCAGVNGEGLRTPPKSIPGPEKSWVQERRRPEVERSEASQGGALRGARRCSRGDVQARG